MGRLDMKLKPRSSAERFLTVCDVAYISVDVLVGSLMMLEMLFKLEGLPAFRI